MKLQATLNARVKYKIALIAELQVNTEYFPNSQTGLVDVANKPRLRVKVKIK